MAAVAALTRSDAVVCTVDTDIYRDREGQIRSGQVSRVVVGFHRLGLALTLSASILSARPSKTLSSRCVDRRSLVPLLLLLLLLLLSSQPRMDRTWEECSAGLAYELWL